MQIGLKIMNEKDLLAVPRGMKRIKLLSVTTLITLIASQSVYAADSTSTFLNLGVPGWVWLLIVLAILIGVTLLPKKWVEPSQNKKKDSKPPTPAPVVKPAVTKAPVTQVKTQAPKVEVAPVVTPAPTVIAPPAVAPVIETAPQVEIKQEVQPEKQIEPDALDEAKQFLAQQRFPQAVGILNKGLFKDPSRSDLMLALLEIYLKQDDHEAFETQFNQLKELNDPFALIQAEELHRKLERPVIAEESDHIEFDSSHAVISEPEPEIAVPAHDYAADSLDFTSAKIQSDDLTLESEIVSTEPAVITPVEHEFSLDDIDLSDSVSENKETTTEVSAKSNFDDFDFSTLDFTGSEAPKSEVVAKVDSPIIPAVEPESKTPTNLGTSPVVDLDFNFDDSFAIEEDKQEVTPASKSNWSDELANESFTSSTPAPEVKPTLGEIIKGDDLSSLEEEFPFLQTVDTFQTRLELARHYIVLGEIDSARELLNEVAEQGGSAQQSEARELIAKLAS
jgi:pilus assembly protein FimV